MTGVGGIQYPTTSSAAAPNNYISAGGGYSAKSGKEGVKLIACDQGDIVSGLGQDCAREATTGIAVFPYDLWVVGGKQPSAENGYISFGFHEKGKLDYKRVGYFNYAGNLYITGQIYEQGNSLHSTYVPRSSSEDLSISYSSVAINTTKGKDVSINGIKAATVNDIPKTYAGSSSAGGAANKVANSITFKSNGSGAATGTTFDGSTPHTISYNTIGAASSTRVDTIESSIGNTVQLDLNNYATKADLNNIDVGAKIYCHQITASSLGSNAYSITCCFYSSNSAQITSFEKLRTSIPTGTAVLIA